MPVFLSRWNSQVSMLGQRTLSPLINFILTLNKLKKIKQYSKCLKVFFFNKLRVEKMQNSSELFKQIITSVQPETFFSVCYALLLPAQRVVHAWNTIKLYKIDILLFQLIKGVVEVGIIHFFSKKEATLSSHQVFKLSRAANRGRHILGGRSKKKR